MQKLWLCYSSIVALLSRLVLHSLYFPFPKLSKSIHGKKEREEDGLLYLSARCMVKTLTYQVLKQRKENLKFWRGLLFLLLTFGQIGNIFGHKRFAISTVLKKHLLWISFEKQWNDGQRGKFQFLWERKEHLPNSIDVGTYSPFLDFPS